MLGAVFIVSGFVKAVDPLGTFYKLQEYLRAFGLAGWCPAYIILLAAVLLAFTEFCAGMFLFLGIRRVGASWILLLLLLFMTPLTLYLAVANPVSDCGCFGDAWVLTNWETFGKNVVLLALAVYVFKGRKLIFRFITVKLEWVMSMYTMLFVVVLSIYCLRNLPILDFRPYRIGVNIPEAMGIPEGEAPAEMETRFIMEKDGKRETFTLDNYPDSTWTFVEARTVVARQGYVPPIHDFSLSDAVTGEDLTDSILSRQGYVFLLVAPYIEQADDSNIDLINEIYDYSVERGYGFWAVTASQDDAIGQWRDKTGAEYPFCTADDTTLKTIIRSNPGMLLLKQGTILNKWSHHTLPDEYVLTDALERLPLGQQKQVDDWRTIGYVLLWYIVPLTGVLAVDLLFVKQNGRIKNMHVT